MDSHEIAYLSHKGKYTAFKFNDLIIRFLTSSRLNKYLNIKKWNYGYLEVMADYQKVGIVEDYIDLRPILDNLNIDKKLFLTPIKEVQIKLLRLAMTVLAETFDFHFPYTLKE